MSNYQEDYKKLFKKCVLESVLLEDEMDSENTPAVEDEDKDVEAKKYAEQMYLDILNCRADHDGKACLVNDSAETIMADRLSRQFKMPFQDAYTLMNEYLKAKYGDWQQNLMDNNTQDSEGDYGFIISIDINKPTVIPNSEEQMPAMDESDDANLDMNIPADMTEADEDNNSAEASNDKDFFPVDDDNDKYSVPTDDIGLEPASDNNENHAEEDNNAEAPVNNGEDDLPDDLDMHEEEPVEEPSDFKRSSAELCTASTLAVGLLPDEFDFKDYKKFVTDMKGEVVDLDMNGDDEEFPAVFKYNDDGSLATMLYSGKGNQEFLGKAVIVKPGNEAFAVDMCDVAKQIKTAKSDEERDMLKDRLDDMIKDNQDKIEKTIGPEDIEVTNADKMVDSVVEPAVTVTEDTTEEPVDNGASEPAILADESDEEDETVQAMDEIVNPKEVSETEAILKKFDDEFDALDK